MHDIEWLQDRIHYYDQTGELMWLFRPVTDFSSEREAKRWNSRYAGKPAISSISTSGYLAGVIGKKHYKAHRLAWAIFYGEWPAGEIDHIDGNPKNNKIANLRECTRAQNAKNVAPRRGGTSQYRGVARDAGKWRAQINSDGKRTLIGWFKRERDAAIAYDLFAIMMHGEFARPNIVNDRKAITAFVDDYARRNHATAVIDGVRVWKERAAR